MAGLKIKADDEVVIIAGKDKGKTGRVLRVDPRNDKVYVEGLNMVKRHMKATPGRPNAPVGVIDKEAAIHVSNVAIVDPKTHKPTRVGISRREDGRRVRVTKDSKTELDS